MSPFLPVLAYQKIGRVPQNSHLKKEWASLRSFTRTITQLVKQKYTFITPLDLQKELPPKPVMLTFFGGYQSFYTDVFPLLQAQEICATLFVAADTLGTYNRWQEAHEEPWQNIVTVKQLQEMAKSGRVQIGTLGLDGHNLLADESTLARQNLEESIYRLKTLHKLDVCALGFWPNTLWNETHAQHLTRGLNLPVITAQKGLNPRTEKQVLRVLQPGFYTQFWLWKNK